MKREFLQEFKVADQQLPKEVIDAIMAENGRDIQKVKAGFSDYDAMKQELELLRQTAQDAQTHKAAAAAWEEKYTSAMAEHQIALQQMAFDHSLDSAIGKAGGRSCKAIRAMLDLDALKASEEQSHAMEEALEELKRTSSYLFETERAPGYAWGTGAWQGVRETAPTTLAGALRERFERK